MYIYNLIFEFSKVYTVQCYGEYDWQFKIQTPMQDESHWVYQNRKNIHWSLNHTNWSLNGCQWDISWWQFDISESEISADVNAIRRILVIVSRILADANGISAEYQWNWWNISNIVANTISVVTKIVGLFLLRETISFVRKPIEKLRTILGKFLLFFTKVTHLLVKLMHSFAKVSHLFAKVMRLLRENFFLPTKILQFVCVTVLGGKGVYDYATYSTSFTVSVMFTFPSVRSVLHNSAPFLVTSCIGLAGSCLLSVASIILGVCQVENKGK